MICLWSVPPGFNCWTSVAPAFQNGFVLFVFRKLPLIYVFSYFPFGFEGRMWDLIVSVPDHCLSFYFAVEYSSCFISVMNLD